MTRLCELAEKYGSDKVKSIHHDYTPFYEELLRGREIKRVLEIGIGTPQTMRHVPNYKYGASLYMWRAYFPDAEIWGIDIDPATSIKDFHIRTLICDQRSEDELTVLSKWFDLPFDLIIDDGSHDCNDQALTANTLIPRLLSPTGVYVIEDVIWRKELYAKLPFPVEVKIFNLKHTPDDCLFIIEGSKL